ncbi:hypothetical protein D9M70_429000 [compost metagenome]
MPDRANADHHPSPPAPQSRQHGQVLPLAQGVKTTVSSAAAQSVQRAPTQAECRQGLHPLGAGRANIRHLALAGDRQHRGSLYLYVQGRSGPMDFAFPLACSIHQSTPGDPQRPPRLAARTDPLEVPRQPRRGSVRPDSFPLYRQGAIHPFLRRRQRNPAHEDASRAVPGSQQSNQPSLPTQPARGSQSARRMSQSPKQRPATHRRGFARLAPRRQLAGIVLR